MSRHFLEPNFLEPSLFASPVFWLRIGPAELSHAALQCLLAPWQKVRPNVQTLPSGEILVSLDPTIASATAVTWQTLEPTLQSLFELGQEALRRLHHLHAVEADSARLTLLVGLEAGVQALVDSAKKPLSQAITQEPLLLYVASELLPFDASQPPHYQRLYPMRMGGLESTIWFRYLSADLCIKYINLTNRIVARQLTHPLNCIAHMSWNIPSDDWHLDIQLRLTRVERDTRFDSSSKQILQKSAPLSISLYRGDQLQLSATLSREMAWSVSLLFLRDMRWYQTHLSGELSIHSPSLQLILDGEEGNVTPVLLFWRSPHFSHERLSLLLENLQGEEGPISGSTPTQAVMLLAHHLRDAMRAQQLHHTGLKCLEALEMPLDASDLTAFSLYQLEALQLQGSHLVLEPSPLPEWRALLGQGRALELLEESQLHALQHLPWVWQLEGALMRAFVLRQAHVAQAEAPLRTIVEQARAAGYPHLEARALRELGRCLLDLNRAAEAEPVLNQAILRLETLHDPVEAARARLHLALLHLRADAAEPALKLYQSIAISALQAQDRVLLGNALTGQGQSLHELGREHEAAGVFQQAEALFVHSGDVAGQHRSAGDLSNLAYEFGHPLDAIQHARRQRMLAQALGQEVPLGRADLNLGRALAAAGEGMEAVPLLQEALEKLPPSDVEARALSTVYLGEALLQSALVEEALARLELEPFLAPILPGSAIPDSTPPRSRVELLWQGARVIAACLKRLNRPREATEVFERGLAFLEYWRHRLTHPARAQAQEVSVRFQQAYVQHVLEVETNSARILEAIERTRARSLTEALRTRMGDSNAKIEPDEAVEITALSFFWLEESLVVARRHRGQTQHRHVPLDRTRFERALQHLQAGVYQIPISSVVVEALHTLSEILLTPLHDWLSPLLGPLSSDAPRVQASASSSVLALMEHGLLHRVPWQALPLPPACDPESWPLGTRIPFFRCPSLEALELLGSTQTAPAGGVTPQEVRSPGSIWALLMGDSTQDLPFAREEVLTLASLFPRARTCVGAEATARALEAWGPDADLLHLALHADPTERDEPPHIRLARAADSSHAAASPPATSSNRKPDPLDRLNLRAELVTLSVCSANRGAINRSNESPDLLPQRLLKAGARAVLASGWPLNDEGLLPFFESLYRRLVGGERLALALQQALAESFAHTLSREDWLAGPGTFSLFGSGCHSLW